MTNKQNKDTREESIKNHEKHPVSNKNAPKTGAHSPTHPANAGEVKKTDPSKKVNG